jgi:RNA polymerase sigma factor (TIGR02999 family)
MPEPVPHNVTMLLDRVARGDEAAAARLIPLVYDELRELARRHLKREGDGGGVTLSPTALVHEAYVKLVGAGGTAEAGWENRRHFFGSAARAMRQVLVDRARRNSDLKHGRARPHVSLDNDELGAEPPPQETLALDRALCALEARDPRQAEVVLLRFFAGCPSSRPPRPWDSPRPPSRMSGPMPGRSFAAR